eukprot:Gb_10906 [translate_table: standard]
MGWGYALQRSHLRSLQLAFSRCSTCKVSPTMETIPIGDFVSRLPAGRLLMSFGDENSQIRTQNQMNICHNSEGKRDFCGISNGSLSGGNYSMLNSSGLQHRYKNWQEERRLKLTASTFSSAIGFWKGRRMQLWMEKIGLIEPFKGSPATYWSNIQEDVAMERYELITGNYVTFAGFEVYNKNGGKDDWLAASPDGVIDQSPFGYLQEGGVLEIKCPYFQGNVKEAFPWSTIPVCYMPQAQGLMEILDRNWADFYVWTPNGSSLFRIQRDPEYWQLIMSALSDFWWKHVEPAKEIRTRHADKNIVKFKPSSKHELFGLICTKSEHLVQDSKLLVREVHGKMRL